MYPVDPKHGTVANLLDWHHTLRREPRRPAEELSKVHAEVFPYRELCVRLRATQGH